MPCYSVPGGIICGRGGRGSTKAVVLVTYEGCTHTRRMEVDKRVAPAAFVGMTSRCADCGEDRTIAGATVTSTRLA